MRTNQLKPHLSSRQREIALRLLKLPRLSFRFCSPFLLRAVCTVLIVHLFTIGELLAQPREVQSTKGTELTKLIQLALERSHRLSSARKGVESAESGLHAAQWERIPKVHASTSYEKFPWLDKLVTMRHMDIPATMGPEMLDIFRRQFVRDVYNFGVMVSYPLYAGGRIGAQIDMAAAGLDVAAEEAQSTQDDLIHDVAQTYYNILKLRKMIEANKKAVEFLEESHRIVQKTVEVGKAAPLDLYRITARLANIKQDLIAAQNMESKAYTRLNVLIGQENLAERIPILDSLTYAPKKFDLQQGIDLAMEQSPVYRVVKSKVSMQKSKLSIARSMLVPNVMLTGGYQAVYSERHKSPIWDGMIVLGLSFPIIDGTVWNNISKESAGADQMEEMLQQVQLNVKAQVRSAYLDILASEEKVKAAEAALTQAVEGLRIEQLKLQTGKGIVNDVLDAQADQLQNEVNYLQAIADYNISIIALQRAVGRVPVEE